MAYIIENANILKNNQLNNCSILIKNNEIAEIKPNLGQYKFIKMNLGAYIMTPTYCLFDPLIPLYSTSREVKEYMTEKFLMKGCTAILTYVSISSEKEIPQKIKEMKSLLMNSPVDFLVAVKIPLQLLSQSFIRACKKEKIPAIFVEISQAEDLVKIPWGWLREALFPYNSTLIPIISSVDKKDSQRVLSKWKGIVEKEKLSALMEELEIHQPLPVHILNKIGVFPHRASLMHGTELSYNLYFKGRDFKNTDEMNLFSNHDDRLVITVHKGKVIRSGTEVLFKPGNGEHVKVRTPAFFSL